MPSGHGSVLLTPQISFVGRGFSTQILHKGDKEVIEIVPIGWLGKTPATDVKHVMTAELETCKADSSTIVISIPLAHVTPQFAIEHLRPLHATTSHVTIAKAAKALLVQGNGAEVYCAWRMIRLIDVPPIVVSKVVALEHAVAAELAVGLKALVADRKPAVVVAAHETANSLLISGPTRIVEEIVELVALLDQATKK